jgi:hypothetical protein
MLVNRCCDFRRQELKKKEAEKISKCKDLTVEILRMWNAAVKVIPVIIVAAGIISK